MGTLLYDQTPSQHIDGIIHSSDSYIVYRVKMDGPFDSIIDSCMESVSAFGVYKLPTDKKNVLGDLDNSMLWTIITLIAVTSFSFGIAFSNLNLSKYLEPKASRQIQDTVISKSISQPAIVIKPNSQTNK